MFKITCGVFMSHRGYQGIIHGKLGSRTIWSERIGRIRSDILSAYTDAQLAAARARK